MSLTLIQQQGTLEITFGQQGNTHDWYIVNDTVMGGVSHGNLSESENSLDFTGKVSLENNGGFASIRSPYGDFKLAKFKSVTIQYASNGFDFAMTMQTHAKYFMPKYKYTLPKTNGKWQTATIPLEDFEAYALSDKLGYHFKSHAQDAIIRIGFISDEKRAGDFEFKLASITFQ